MYLIPKDIEIAKLENVLITQICYSSNNISLYFETIGYIIINGEFVISHKNKSEHHEIIEIPISRDFGLLRLMGKKSIHLFSDKERRNLIIKFEDDYSLKLINDRQYESFIVCIEDTTTII